ncbi:DUF1801 domain-containing protein [Dyadobacter tibetensis]|uniref:DUF1801 domain-containing protein n=1 Tax=Dyadobacter tibetensis TaxID=1211851 RepID=UPI0004702114|nr:DUF1801 domain-containing protein [Dyadobacter tibetensis]
MISDIESFYYSKTEPVQGCLLALRQIILEQDDQITETQKYGMPCFCYRNKMFCYLWTDKKTNDPYILMVEGNRLIHPALEKGDRTRMKVYRVDPWQDLPLDELTEVLGEGLKLYYDGHIKVK